MSAEIYANVNGVTRKAKKLYANVNGVTREIKEMYANVNGVTRKIYQAMPKLIDTKYMVYGLDESPTISIVNGAYRVHCSRVDDYARIYPFFDRGFTITRATLYAHTNRLKNSEEHDITYFVSFMSGGNTLLANSLYKDKLSFSETNDRTNWGWEAGSASLIHFNVVCKTNDSLYSVVDVRMDVTTKEFGTFSIPG